MASYHAAPSAPVTGSEEDATLAPYGTVRITAVVVAVPRRRFTPPYVGVSA